MLPLVLLYACSAKFVAKTILLIIGFRLDGYMSKGQQLVVVESYNREKVTVERKRLGESYWELIEGDHTFVFARRRHSGPLKRCRVERGGALLDLISTILQDRKRVNVSTS
ncbi:hypothetical protein ACFE04_009708 [Oxalis oulophora]